MGLSEFLGNERIVTALRGALRSQRVPHALLFTGPRGVGKFTLARMFAQAANCERLTDDFCGECATCQRISQLADPQTLIEQGLVERGESADAATVERVPLILQSHPDVWALVPDPVRLKSPVARPMLRVGQLRAVQRAAYFQPMGRRRVFILDGAETMHYNVSNVFLKILEEPPGSATLILTAPSPYSLLTTIVSRCLQFHFAPLPQAAVEKILKEKTDRKPPKSSSPPNSPKAAPASPSRWTSTPPPTAVEALCKSSNVPRRAKGSASFSPPLRLSPKTATPLSRIRSAFSMACSPISSNLRPK